MRGISKKELFYNQFKICKDGRLLYWDMFLRWKEKHFKECEITVLIYKIFIDELYGYFMLLRKEDMYITIGEAIGRFEKDLY